MTELVKYDPLEFAPRVQIPVESISVLVPLLWVYRLRNVKYAQAGQKQRACPNMEEQKELRCRSSEAKYQRFL